MINKCCKCGNNFEEPFKIHSDGRVSCCKECAKVLDSQMVGLDWVCKAGHGS